MSEETATKGGNPLAGIIADEASQKDDQASSHSVPAPELLSIPIERIDSSPYQVREVFDESTLRELASSIKQVGLMQPILVRPLGERFQLVAGERRLRAARLLGWSSIPALVREFSDLDAAVRTMVENEQRQDANALERARGYKRLTETFNLQQEEVAQRVGVSRTKVTRLLSLLKEPEEIQKLVASGSITATHLRSLDGIEDKAARIEVARQAAEKHWTADETKHRSGKVAKGRSSEHQPKKASDSSSSDSLAGHSESSDSPSGHSKSSDPLLRVAEEHVSQVMRWIRLLRWLFNWLRRVAIRLLPTGQDRRVGHLPPPDPDPIDPPDPVEPPGSKPSKPKAA